MISQLQTGHAAYETDKVLSISESCDGKNKKGLLDARCGSIFQDLLLATNLLNSRLVALFVKRLRLVKAVTIESDNLTAFGDAHPDALPMSISLFCVLTMGSACDF